MHMRLASVVLALLATHFAFGQQPPKVVVPDGVTFERDIEYANPDDQHLKLNLARPTKSEGLLPAVVCIHGGGFRAGSREGYNGTILKLNRAASKKQFTISLYPFPVPGIDEHKREHCQSEQTIAPKLAEASRANGLRSALDQHPASQFTFFPFTLLMPTRETVANW